MIRRLKDIGGFLVYIVVALTALLLASWMSSMFMSKAVSQTPPGPPSAVAAPPPGVPLPQPGAPNNPPPNPEAQGQSQVPGDAGSAQNPPPAPNPGPQISTQPGSLLPPLGSKTKGNPLADIIEDYNYVSKDKRDPFMPFERPQSVVGMVGPLWPLQGFDLDQLKLVGIIWDVKNPKAMIMDPSGKGYVVRVNERIGRSNGYIARIREGEIVIVESVNGLDGKISYTTKLIKLQND